MYYRNLAWTQITYITIPVHTYVSVEYNYICCILPFTIEATRVNSFFFSAATGTPLNECP